MRPPPASYLHFPFVLVTLFFIFGSEFVIDSLYFLCKYETAVDVDDVSLALMLGTGVV